MSFSKDIAKYPNWCFALARAFLKGATSIEIPFNDSNSAISARHKFYMFRTLLEEPSLLAAANTIMLKIPAGRENVLKAVHVDLDTPQIIILQQDIPAAPLGAAPAQTTNKPQVDAVEDYYEKTYGPARPRDTPDETK